MTAQEYIKQELDAGRLTLAHIEALTWYYQNGQLDFQYDGKPGPQTRGKLEKAFPRLFTPPGPVPLAQLGRWLSWPLPLLPGKSSPQARKPHITSGFRPVSRPDHDGLDLFYRWEPGDEPKFVGDGGCEGKLSDGNPKWVVPYGTYAMAAADGVVQISGVTPTGYRIWLDHGNGWRTGYFHLETADIYSGERVKAGYALGRIGHNPSKQDGRHLHFKLSPVGRYEPVNPEPCLKVQ